jgi:hypothetical protein
MASIKCSRYLILIIFSCSGCVLNQKYLARNQTIYKVDNPGGGALNYTINAYHSNTKMRVKIEESGSKLLIQRSPTETNSFINFVTVRNAGALPPTHMQLFTSGKYYFSESIYPYSADPNSNLAFQGPDKLKYKEDKIVLQALSIPLKIRTAIKMPRYKDSLPSFVETGFNAGLATGIKRTWTTYSSELNAFGTNYRRFSLAVGPFLNIGGTDVKKSTTDYTITFDRKEPYYSYGLFFLVGFNNINLGYSVGADYLFSSRNKNWVYRGRAWHGITVALDILK